MPLSSCYTIELTQDKFPLSASLPDENQNRKREQDPEERSSCVPAKRHQPERQYHPLSTPSTNPNQEALYKKRRHPSPHNINDFDSSKRPRLIKVESTICQEYNPVKYWVLNGVWPRDYIEKGPIMSQASSKRRKTESKHSSAILKRLRENGILMSSSPIQRASKDLCNDLMNGDHRPSQYPPFPPEQLSKVLERIQELNESRIQRDVTPWVVPSAELLFFCGELENNYIGDEVNAEWTGCTTMVSTRPKPNYTAGLLPSAFTADETRKLQNYASSSRPVFFTPDLCFPFLICEVEQGLDKAI